MFRILLLGLLAPGLVVCQSRGGGGPYPATPQRPTFTSDTSTTAPGTLELEFGPTIGDGAYSLPTAVKFTPDAAGGLLHQAEFSVGFDSFSAVSVDGKTVTQFGDRVNLTLRRPVYQGGALSFAVAPQATFLTRGGSGARLGMTGLMAYALGLNAVVLNATWTAATSASPANPQNAYDFALNLSRQMARSGPWSRLALFAGALNENASGRSTEASLEQGLAYRVRPNMVLDVAVRQIGLVSGRNDYQVLTGVTINVGKPGEW